MLQWRDHDEAVWENFRPGAFDTHPIPRQDMSGSPRHSLFIHLIQTSRRNVMRNIALVAIPSMYLIDAGSLALADDAMKNERGR